jgi:predicted Zn-dependent protease
MALLGEAEASSASGSLEEAAAILERAIRLQPRNPELWHKLAEIRLKQHQPGLAEDLAKKSNVLGPNDKTLASQNWALIAEARRKKGDMEGAAEADAKAGR